MGIVRKNKTKAVWSGMQLCSKDLRNQSRVDKQDRIHTDELGRERLTQGQHP